MFTPDIIKQKIGTVVYDNKMQQYIEQWNQLYNAIDKEKTLGLPAAISNEVAVTVLNEAEFNVKGNPLIQKAFKNFKAKIATNVEFAVAKGGIMIKPFYDSSNKEVRIDYFQAEAFMPIRFNDESPDECLFFEKYVDGKIFYTRIEWHDYRGLEGYTIRNIAFKSQTESDLGVRCSLLEVSEWEHLQEEVNIVNAKGPFYSYFKMPFGNTADNNSRMGVSIFHRSISQIKEADEIYAKLLWEFESGDRAVFASDEMFKKNSRTGEYQIPKNKKRIYNLLESPVSAFALETFSPEFRNEAISRGLNDVLRVIERNSFLSYGILSDSQTKELTATEVLSSKRRYYATITGIQAQLQFAIEDMLETILDLLKLYKANTSAYEISIIFNDSVLQDDETQKNFDRMDVNAGLMSKVEYRMKWFGEDEEQAKKSLEAIKSEQELVVY